VKASSLKAVILFYPFLNSGYKNFVTVKSFSTLNREKHID
jgi:hypothetical protein